MFAEICLVYTVRSQILQVKQHLPRLVLGWVTACACRRVELEGKQVQYVALRNRSNKRGLGLDFSTKYGEMKYALWSISSVATKKTRIQELESP